MFGGRISMVSEINALCKHHVLAMFRAVSIAIHIALGSSQLRRCFATGTNGSSNFTIHDPKVNVLNAHLFSTIVCA